MGTPPHIDKQAQGNPFDTPLNVFQMSVEAVKHLGEKVDRVAFHPTHPFVAYVERDGAVGVWNFVSNEMLYTNQFGGADEGAMQEIGLRRRAEYSAGMLGGKKPSSPGGKDPALAVKGVSSGRVNDIVFVDHDTCLWQQAVQESLDTNSYDVNPGLNQLTKTSVRGITKHCWIVAACDNKVTIHDLSSSSTRDFSRASMFDSKTPTRVAVLVLNARSLTGHGVSEQQQHGQRQSEYVAVPILAVGTSSGSIYLVDFHCGKVYAKCSGGHNKAITALQVIGPSRVGGPDRLVSGSSDGSIAIWDPSLSPKSLKGGEADIRPIKTFKAHDAGVHDLELFGLEAAAKGQLVMVPCIASVGADRQLRVWNTRTWSEIVLPLQVLPKSSLKAIASSMGGGLSLGSRYPLFGISDESCILFGLDPKESKSKVHIDITGIVDRGQKKMPKIYHMAASPTRPGVVALATNTGVVVLKDRNVKCPGSLSLTSQQMFANMYNDLMSKRRTAETKEEKEEEENERKEEEEEEEKKVPQGITTLNVLENKLLASLYQMQMDRSVDVMERLMHLEKVGSIVLAELDHPLEEDISIHSSPSGKCISIVWPQQQRYCIYACDSSFHWYLIDSGDGCGLVWSSTAPIYAVLKTTMTNKYSINTTPNETNFQTKDDVKQGHKSEDAPEQTTGKFDTAKLEPGLPEEKEEKKEPAPTVVPAAPVAEDVFQDNQVRVHAIDEAGDPKYIGSNDVALGGAQPSSIFGGALLGIAAVDTELRSTSLRFFSWVDFSPIGNNMPEPKWISWEPECTICAIAYETCIQLFEVYPSFNCFATIAIDGAHSSFWQSRQLFVSTENSIYLIFADPSQGYVQEIKLGDFHGHTTESPGMNGRDVFGPVRLRPAGPLRLVGMKHSHLLIHDAHERPFLLSLRSHGLRVRSLAARSDIQGAERLGSRNIHPSLHDSLAEFIIAMGVGTDYEYALRLPGLTPEMEISIAIRTEDWGRAARAFQAYAVGFSDRIYSSLIKSDIDIGENISSLTDSRAFDQRNMTAVSNILAEATAEEDETKESPESPQHNGIDESEEEESEEEQDGENDIGFIDPIDWDAWQSVDELCEKSKGKTLGSRTLTVEPSELQRAIETVDLGLELSDMALHGHQEAARTVLGALLGYAPTLPRDRAEQLVGLMVMGSMTESLRNVTGSLASSAPNSALHSAPVAALLAASVGGLQQAAVSSALQSSGLYPLAFLYAAVWGQGSPEAMEGIWRDRLRSI